MTTKAERVTARLNDQSFEIITRAAELVGSSISQFLVVAGLERAKTVLEEEQVLRLSMRDAEVFFGLLDNPPTPSEKALAAARRYKEMRGTP